MKRSALNLILLLVVAALGITVWLSQEKEETGPPLTALDPDQVTRVAVEHPGKPAIRLEKREDAWHLVEPVQAPVDRFEIGGILSLATLEVKKQLDAGADLAQLELDPPRYSVSLDDTRIDLGGAEPIQYRRYVASGEVVGLVDDPPSAALDADFSDLVSKSIVPEGRELLRIELPGLTVVRQSDGQWHSPQQAEADAAQLARLAQSWKDARAMWNAAAEEAGTEADGEPVRLTLADGEVIELSVQAREPQLVLARDDYQVRYTLSKALADELLQVPAAPDAAQPTSEASEANGGSDPAPDASGSEPGEAGH